jgi:hypothetical protein
VADTTLAAQLAEFGQRTRSALALAAAAELLSNAPVPKVTREKADHGGGRDGTPVTGAHAPAWAPAEAAALFAEAVALAREGSNDHLADAIEMAARKALTQPGGKRSKTGAAHHSDRLRPHSTDVYKVRFKAGFLARATVVADYGQDVDLFVFDNSGNLVAYDNSIGSTGACHWVPGETSEYSLRVANTSGLSVDYSLFTN